MMHLTIADSHVTFANAEAVAGRYNHRDSHKPFVHPLCTPAGHCVSLASPHDHKHHKALMYALRASDVNFWEEFPTLPGERVGRQRHIAFEDVVASGGTVGFAERLEWWDEAGADHVFGERREIRCRFEPAKNAFVWAWQTRITAQRDVTLIQSQWSHGLPSGGKVNYHGLAVRLRRDFGGSTRNHTLTVDGATRDTDFKDLMGARPTEVSFVGSIDGTWPVQRAGVAFRQRQHNPLYVMEDHLAFMALGPSNLGAVELKKGAVLEEAYEVEVFDVR